MNPRWQSAPTPDEVRAHAAKHPVTAPIPTGRWLLDSAVEGGFIVDVWREEGYEFVHGNGIAGTVDAIDDGYRWCPCTADGVALREGEA